MFKIINLIYLIIILKQLVMKKYRFIIALIFTFSFVIFNSCKKKEVVVDSETQSVVDNAICEQQFMSIAPNVNSRGGNPKSNGFKTTACGTWSIITTNMADTNVVDPIANPQYVNGPVKFTLDYGTGSTCEGGVTKSGMITVVTTHKWSLITATTTAVASSTITFTNYKSDGVQYDCSSIIIKKLANQLTTKVNGGHCQKDGWNIYYGCDKTITKDANGDYDITGTSNGTNREGRDFAVNITQSLFKPNNYKFITKGKLELTPNGFKTRMVDFGTGTLDDQATFTIDGQTFTFTMK